MGLPPRNAIHRSHIYIYIYEYGDAKRSEEFSYWTEVRSRWMSELGDWCANSCSITSYGSHRDVTLHSIVAGTLGNELPAFQKPSLVGFN